MSQQIEVNIPDLFRKGFVLWILVGLLVVVGFITSMYTVQAESQGVVLRFGKYLKTVEPGLRFKLPFGVDNVYVLPVRRQLKQEYGFGTPGGNNNSQFAESRTRSREKSMMTGDLNAAEVEWIVQYRINDPRLFLFKVMNPESTLRHVSEAVMRTVVGDRTVDEVITIGRQDIEAEARIKLEELVEKYALGLHIDQVQLKNVNPPEPVQNSFNEVNQAQQEREQRINTAESEKNKVIPKAEGDALRVVEEANGYAEERVNMAQGEADAFKKVFASYQLAPEVTRKRIFLETMGKILASGPKKIVMDEEAKGLLPLLNINPEGK